MCQHNISWKFCTVFFPASSFFAPRIYQPCLAFSLFMDQHTFVALESISSPQNASHEAVPKTITGSNVLQPTNECQLQQHDVPAGYPKLAERMGLIPEIAIFRRFGFLNQLNILYMQAELKDLEEKLEEIQRRDGQSNGEERRYARDFYFLKESNEDAGEQLELVMKIREKLEKYSKH